MSFDNNIPCMLKGFQNSGGTVIEDIDEDTKSQSCLSREAAERLGKLAIKIERYYKSSRDIEWGILDDELYILQSRPVTNATAETDHEIKHEFDAPLRSESEYFTVANVGEVMPGATSPLGIETLTKCFSNVLKREAFEKGIVDNLFQSKYFLTGILPFFNNMMITVAEMLVRYGLNTPRSKGFMISVFGRILDDPDLLEYASHKAPGELKSSLMSDLRYYKELFFFDYGIEKAKKKFDNYHLDFLKPTTAKETFKAILNSCSDFDEAIEYHMQCSENSSNWNMYMFTTLCDAKGNFDTDVYSDFASLLATSSDVESANVPQAMQDVADQIVKDIGTEKFSSMSFDVKSITWGMDPKLLVKLLQKTHVIAQNATNGSNSNRQTILQRAWDKSTNAGWFIQKSHMTPPPLPAIYLRCTSCGKVIH
ncbi:putative phosphoenolpyruvate synthase [Trichonephila clavipes]|nr:putative phosphoenolpyruvate synthase [Trichonephila clavipes]